MGKTTYTFGPDFGQAARMNSQRCKDAFFYLVKSRTDQPDRNGNVYVFDWEQCANRFREQMEEARRTGAPFIMAEQRHRPADYQVVGTHTGRMSSATPNITSEVKRVFLGKTCMWCGGDCHGHDRVIVDEDAMQFICAKVGVPTSMTDPVKLQKYKERSYGSARFGALAYG